MKKLFLLKSLVCNDVLALLPRFILALVFIFHGGQKVFGWFDGAGLNGTVAFMNGQLGIPIFFAYLASFTEFFGAVFLLIGFLTRISAAGIGISMLVAIATVHPNTFLLQNGGMEYPLTLFIVALLAFLIGPGKVSLDAILFHKSAKNSSVELDNSF